MWQWKAESGSTITRQMRRLGASCDWGRERFTMDEGLSAVVTEVFVRLYEQGLIYRGKRLVNWDPVLQTAVSDLEVESHEEAGQLWFIRYPLASGEGHVIVATTRPETMLGDVAVAVHPEDPRYRKYIGESVLLPLAHRKIPVIADSYVDPEFGTARDVQTVLKEHGVLVTSTAPWLYEKVGYSAINHPDFVWQIARPDIYRR